MGYVRARKTYKLIFTDDEYDGLEVVAKSASVEAYRRIALLATREYSQPPSAEDLEEIDHLHRAFASVLVSWNLEEPEGVAVAATFDGLRSQEPDFVQAIIVAWMDAVVGVAPPLDSSSTGGDALLEASLPMDALS